MACLAGCTPWSQYVRNGFRVGPNYARPPAPVARDWIDAKDDSLATDALSVRRSSDDLSAWWTVLDDPVLDALVQRAARENLTVRQAGFRVLEARAQLAIAKGNLFPQVQQAVGDYSRNKISESVTNQEASPKKWFSLWDAGFNLAWELDFWGQFMRAVESAAADLDASVENYDDVLVTLLADVATAYVRIRTLENRITVAERNVKDQKRLLEVARAKFKGELVSEIAPDQAEVTLRQTQALIPSLKIQQRQAENQLCILLGLPPREVSKEQGFATAAGRIPQAPAEVAVGIPADLLRRRPDVRRAERQAASQCAQIGVATAELYPHIAVTGTIGLQAEYFPHLFDGSKPMVGSVGPSFHWNILNYGRLQNNIHVQDARFLQLVTNYQNTVLKANAEVENALVAFLRSQERAGYLGKGTVAARKGLKVAEVNFQNDKVDFVAVALLEENLAQQEDDWAQAQGDVALGLIQLYRALGGGWQIRLGAGQQSAAAEPPAAPRPETIRTPPVEEAPAVIAP